MVNLFRPQPYRDFFVRSYSFLPVSLALFTGAFCSRMQAANLLNDPGFESVPGGVETSSITGWTIYGQTFNTLAESDNTIAHSGVNFFKVFQGFIPSINYNGIFQDNPAQPGIVYKGDGWARMASTDKLAGGNVAWLEVSFRDANTNILALYRSLAVTTNLVTSGSFPLDTWIHLFVTNQYDPNTFAFVTTVSNLTAPSGTALVRYQIVFQGDSAYSSGSLFFDDLNLETTTATNTTSGTAMNIVWNDEFNGNSIDLTHWKFENGNGDGGWGNNELEYYTSRSQNAYTSNGVLHIVAIKEGYNGFNYTSARMKSDGLFSKKYGRFEFRAKLPQGQGYWPALWMMPQDSVYGGWASSGEIDVLENKGFDPMTIYGTIHFGGPYPNNTHSFGPSYALPATNSVTNFHTYVLDWTTNTISWSVDGHLYERQTNWWSASTSDTSIRNPYPAPFNQPFYLILNVAVGGNFGGNPTGTTVFPGEMQVDYIRVYDQTAPLQLAIAQSNSNAILSWPSNIVCHLQVQTNVANGLTGNWTDVVTSATSYTVPFTPSNKGAFFRLASP